MRAAIYVRYSSDSQRDTSLEDQERLCRQEAERLGYTVVTVYSDAALSGQLNEGQRPGFRALMGGAKRREFDVVVVDDASRLSRDTADAARILQRLQYWSVGLVARADGVNTLVNPKSSLLIFDVKSAVNAEFLRDLAEKTWRGLEGRARNGYSPGGLPYGYRSEPVLDDRNRVIGYRRIIHEAEAEVVRMIFRLYVGEEGGYPHSPREIAMRLSDEGVAPPGARWQNRTARQARTWSYTSIIGHRRLQKGILHNVLYIGNQTWNKSRWLRDPDTKQYQYRLRPVDEWVSCDIPELRIVPQALWDRAQVRLALNDLPRVNPRQNVGKYLLSGFVRCAECGGPYSKSSHSFRCSNHRNRGNLACTNRIGVTVRKLERQVIDALRRKLYTPENLSAVVAQVRDELMARVKQEERAVAGKDSTKQLREVEREIENIKAAVRMGKATNTLLEMLEDAERRKQVLKGGREAPPPPVMQARLEKVLAELPERVQAYLKDLETFLTEEHVAEGRSILAALRTQILIRPNGTAEIGGDLRAALKLIVPKRDGESVFRWLGEEDSNPH